MKLQILTIQSIVLAIIENYYSTKAYVLNEVCLYFMNRLAPSQMKCREVKLADKCNVIVQMGHHFDLLSTMYNYITNVTSMIIAKASNALIIPIESTHTLYYVNDKVINQFINMLNKTKLMD